MVMSDILKEVQDFLEDMHIADAYETVRRSQELHEKVKAARAQSGQDLAMACAYCGGAEKVPAQQGIVPEGWKSIVDRIVPDISPEPDQNEYPAEWSVWADRQRIRRELSLLSTPTTPQADGWVRCDERLPTYRDSDEYGDVWAMSKLYDVKKMPWSSVRADFESHWMPTGLKRPQPPKQEGKGDE
jgi:hypothetical protein